MDEIQMKLDIISEIKRRLCQSVTDAKAYGILYDMQQELIKQKTDPKPCPAFIGDKVNCRIEGTQWEVVGPHWGHPQEFVYVRCVCRDSVEKARIAGLRHPDGAPVSRIIEHRRPIPVSERLPTKDDANEHGDVLVFWEAGGMSNCSWEGAGAYSAVVAWLPFPESGVE